ncbi:cytochrome B5 [Candidatus Xianfuyuplasma coldseepsis]|uniref:Cytochrome B5 n=2 Tax=Candidatus Xianfuyuplasma coldseepsis TaxID=2782163 RepID=A0A7L7KTR1_9MOLU|nr:cytochrome B5 [Xianfuyuplasma coldseepsis]
MYDGTGDMDAYVAVSDVVYDVTNSAAWTDGTHNGNSAGLDLTDEILSAPHGESVLDGLTIVGEIVAE